MISKLALNPRVLAAQYAVRGPLVQKAEEITWDLKKHPNKYPFKNVTFLNIGNPQQLDQKPLTFVRQVLSLVQFPKLLEDPPKQFHKDAVSRAKTLLEHTGSVGAYSHSKGVPFIRQSVADFIERRDGYKANPENIFLTGGAGSGASKIMTLLTTGDDTGLMVPIPQYPLYSASSALNGSHFIGYYLNENANWSTSVREMRANLSKARNEGIVPRMLVVINPGNPTGAVLSKPQIEDILKLAKEEDLTIIADEVYQHNVFPNQKNKFVSFKKVRCELIEKDPSFNDVRLVSLHSTSKGFLGECGQRGGYMEVVGFPEEVLDQVYKLASIDLCPPVPGQVLTDVLVNPPKEGDESYDLFCKERDFVLSTLRTRAELLYSTFSKMEGVECQKPQGAMYLFPRISIPMKACAEAEKHGLKPDAFYAMELLKNTGICVVPGSGFGQKSNTFHFRTTFLAPGGQDLSNKFIDFHKQFMAKYK